MLDQLAADEPRVRMLGRQPDTRDLYRAADVVALASLSEGFPVVALEGASSGCPVVVVAGGGFESVVDGWGVVAPDAHPASIAQAIVSAASMDRDAPRRWAEGHSRAAWAQAHLTALRRFAGA